MPAYDRPPRFDDYPTTDTIGGCSTNTNNGRRIDRAIRDLQVDGIQDDEFVLLGSAASAKPTTLDGECGFYNGEHRHQSHQQQGAAATTFFSTTATATAGRVFVTTLIGLAALFLAFAFLKSSHKQTTTTTTTTNNKATSFASSSSQEEEEPFATHNNEEEARRGEDGSPRPLVRIPSRGVVDTTQTTTTTTTRRTNDYDQSPDLIAETQPPAAAAVVVSSRQIAPATTTTTTTTSTITGDTTNNAVIVFPPMQECSLTDPSSIQDMVRTASLIAHETSRQGGGVVDVNVALQVSTNLHVKETLCNAQLSAEYRGYYFEHHQQEANRTQREQHHRETLSFQKVQHAQSLLKQVTDEHAKCRHAIYRSFLYILWIFAILNLGLGVYQTKQYWTDSSTYMDVLCYGIEPNSDWLGISWYSSPSSWFSLFFDNAITAALVSMMTQLSSWSQLGTCGSIRLAQAVGVGVFSWVLRTMRLTVLQYVWQAFWTITALVYFGLFSISQLVTFFVAMAAFAAICVVVIEVQMAQQRTLLKTTATKKTGSNTNDNGNDDNDDAVATACLNWCDDCIQAAWLIPVVAGLVLAFTMGCMCWNDLVPTRVA